MAEKEKFISQNGLRLLGMQSLNAKKDLTRFSDEELARLRDQHKRDGFFMAASAVSKVLNDRSYQKERA